jgi:hypothetical protein
MSKKVARVTFIEPMLLLRTEKLPEGPEWLIELKLDGYRALAIKSGGKVQLRSRNDNDFSSGVNVDKRSNKSSRTRPIKRSINGCPRRDRPAALLSRFPAPIDTETWKFG